MLGYLRDRNKLLRTGLLLIGLALFFNRLMVWWPYKPDSQETAEKIRKNLDIAFEQAETQVKNLQRYTAGKEKLFFYDISPQVKLPLFLIRNGNLVYWSGNKVPLQYDLLKGDYDYRYVRLKNGKYLVRKFQLSLLNDQEKLEGFLFIRLSQWYPIRNQYVHSRPDPDIFRGGSILISSIRTSEPFNFYSPGGSYLFSIDILKEAPSSPNWFILALMFFTGLPGFTCLLLYAVLMIREIRRKNGPDMALVTLFGLLLLLRILLYFFDLPKRFPQNLAFQQGAISGSVFFSSLGDLFLTLLALVVLAYMAMRWLPHLTIFKKYNGSKKNLYVGLVAIGGGYLSASFVVYKVFQYLYYSDKGSPEIGMLLGLDPVRFFSIGCFLLASALFFMVTHIAAVSLIRALQPGRGRYSVWLIFLLVLSCMTFLLSWWEVNFLPVALLSIGYLVFLQVKKLPNALRRLRYVSYLYFFGNALLVSIIATWVNNRCQSEKLQADKLAFAGKVVKEDEAFALYMMDELGRRVARDPFIRTKLMATVIDRDFIETKVRRAYLGEFFSKYETRLSFFNEKGNPLDERNSISPRDFQRGLIQRRKLIPVRYTLPVLQPGSKVPTHYEGYFEMTAGTNTIGYIVLEFIPRKLIPNSIYPELLVDDRFHTSRQIADYGYALYDKGVIAFTSGDFNYFKNLKALTPEIRTKLLAGMYSGPYLHNLFVTGQGREVVVTSGFFGTGRIYANFAFLFLIQAFVILMFVIFNTFYFKIRRTDTTFTTKIQIYLNIAFFVPLLVVSTAIFGIIANTYQTDLHDDFFKKAETVSSNLSENLQAYQSGNLTRELLFENLEQLSRFIQADIHLYGRNGQLLLSTQPRIFDYSLLSNLLNPLVVENIFENRDKGILVNEQIGLLNYNTAFYSIKSFETGELIGVAGVPFFASRKELLARQLEVLQTILGIFVTVFILFLALAYFASNILTRPLQMLAARLRKTSLNKQNEPLSYRANDEIGMLVAEYNKMIIKLEESKLALALNEKEEAWREMARQVAHEIKNPLTPMRLSLQYLQRLMQDIPATEKGQIERSMKTLLSQIDNLTDIADSFSAFTRMPDPMQELFDLSQVVRDTVNLYQSGSALLIDLSLPVEGPFVNGDRKLVSRILTNLIINAFQSVPANREPIIRIWLIVKEKEVVLSISDNGMGIPHLIRDKIFLPNFSTKYAGSGIGLAIVKKGLEQMSARIDFETEEGKGTVFTIRFPR